jgi:hypothetical protein
MLENCVETRPGPRAAIFRSRALADDECMDVLII